LNDVIIVGAGGFGRQLAQHVLEMAEQRPEIRLKGFLDDDPRVRCEFGDCLGAEVIGDTSSYTLGNDDRFLISLGNPELRMLLAERLAERGATFFTLIHPTAYVASTATLGFGCVIGPFASVGSFARLGNHVLLNMYATAGHDARIGSYTVMSPHGVANGGSMIEDRVFFGTSAVVMPDKKVGRQCKIAAGAVVYRDVPDLSLAAGNPAKNFPIGQPDDE
jgi:sugar O-acyltransferase (sialic acid O-acetyltransferase NeuD family)